MNDKEWYDFLAELKAKNDIVDVISSYLPVRQKGRGFWALCPFHNDRNPSLSINREGQYYHCFVCGAGGDIFRFIQNYENCTFMEAVEILAQRANVRMPQFNPEAEKNIAEKKRVKDSCFDVCLFAAKYYRACIKKPENKFAVDYLTGRNITGETIKRFGFGYSDSWEGLADALKREGKNLDTAVKAGLLVRRDDGSYFDALANRLIVPIFDVNGRVIAFGGRTFSKDKDVAKYKNTSVTPVFDKSKTLYALNFAKKAKQSGQLSDYLIIVEGYMDAIALHQAGFVQAVASMGTSLTVEQARQAKRLVSTVYICYDGDAAGQNATVRGLDILKEQGLDVRVVTMPDGVDPDEYVAQNGVEAYRLLLSKALPLVDYKLALAEKAFKPKSDSKSAINEYRRKYAAKALEILMPLSDVDRESYLPALSTATGMTVEFLRAQLMSGKIEVAESKETGVKPPQDVSQDDKAVAYVLASKLNNFSYADDGLTFNSDNVLFNKIFDMITNAKKEGKTVKFGDIYMLEDADSYSESLRVLQDVEFVDEDVDKKSYRDCVDILLKKDLKAKLEKLKNQYAITSDTTEKRNILMEIAEITKKINSKA